MTFTERHCFCVGEYIYHRSGVMALRNVLVTADMPWRRRDHGGEFLPSRSAVPSENFLVLLSCIHGLLTIYGSFAARQSKSALQ